MATIYKKDNQWRAQIRRKGIVKSKQGFKTKREAQEWAFKIEQDIDDYHGDVICSGQVFLATDLEQFAQ